MPLIWTPAFAGVSGGRGRWAGFFPRRRNSYDLRMQRAKMGAARLDDLRLPPGNRLEALSGDRKGQHSIRINQQWRICFRWTEGGCEDVEICDYH